MNKILKPYTIIPADLYVKRDADRQLLNILEDMGRPGYVLVSRQMGKTNLLLNAKREAETPDDIFVYIDLSNPFDNAKDCFENIIDTIVEINEERLRGVSKAVQDIRNENNGNPPHLQHTKELRTILKAIPGKLVIILDEIDALTKSTYSDSIFSQIRSVYFSRVNFPELSKLTYILSGVVEPTEIIKDPKISPFNIGQKIFLNDFSYEEFLSFLRQSELELDNNIIKFVYKRLGGHPRMTWDVCSEIEAFMNEGKITEEDIDCIIKKLYLTSFDKPPIDNIRELVKKDSEIRNAITEIEYNKEGSLSDRIKSKLYLAGIVNFTNENVKLKNEIIKQSLNSDWIKSIEEEEKGLITIALEQYDKGKFKESLSIFQRYLENNSFTDNAKSLCYYHMGYAAYRISDFEKSLQYFNNTSFSVEDETKFYYLTLHLKGLLSYYTGDLENSLKYLKSVLLRSTKDEIFARALVNFGSISLESDNPNHKAEAIKILKEIINEENIDKSKISDEFLNELKSIAYYNLAQIEIDLQKESNAIECYQNAVSLAPDNSKPKIILAQLSATKDNKERHELLQALVDLIVVKNIEPKDDDPEKPMGFNIDQFKKFVILLYLEDDKKLFECIKNKIYLLGSRGFGQILYDLALYSIDKIKIFDAGFYLLKDICNNKDNPDYEVKKETYYDTIKLLSLLSDEEKDFGIIEVYIDAFNTTRQRELDLQDLEIFVKSINYLIKNKKLIKALKYVEIINSAIDTVSEEFRCNYLLIYHLELYIHSCLSDSGKSFDVAGKILTLIGNKKIPLQNDLLGEKAIDFIRSNAQKIYYSAIDNIIPTRPRRKIRPNETISVRYKNGEVKKIKYKKAISDIDSGVCVILESNAIIQRPTNISAKPPWDIRF